MPWRYSSGGGPARPRKDGRAGKHPKTMIQDRFQQTRRSSGTTTGGQAKTEWMPLLSAKIDRYENRRRDKKAPGAAPYCGPQDSGLRAQVTASQMAASAAAPRNTASAPAWAASQPPSAPPQIRQASWAVLHEPRARLLSCAGATRDTSEGCRASRMLKTTKKAVITMARV